MSVLKTLSGCALLLALTAAQARADIVTPVSVTPSSEFAAAVNMIDGSGLDGIGPILGQLHNNNENHMWQSFAATSVGESAIFLLDQPYDLSAAHIWQFNGPAGGAIPVPQREVEDFDISVASGAGPFVSLGTNTLAPALNPLSGPVPDFNEPVQSFPLAITQARRVKITILSVHSPPSDGAAGLSEVRFEGTVIPEPATIGLAVGALSISLGVMRRRRNRT